MAFWGAPVRPGGPRAARLPDGALRFLEKLEELRSGWREEGLPEFDIGVGINTGPDDRRATWARTCASTTR